MHGYKNIFICFTEDLKQKVKVFEANEVKFSEEIKQLKSEIKELEVTMK